jgi:peptidoglycan/xylan/chitin deacetylase (PgdA/CDA1 family)
LNFTATFFIATDFIGKKDYLTWEQISEMHGKGMNIQSHTCTHPILTEISFRQLRYEFTNSKSIIEEKLHKSIDSVAIPQGFLNNNIVQTAKDSGYTYIFSSDPGVYAINSDKIVKRLTVYKHTTISQFKRLVNMKSFELFKQKLYKITLAVPKTVVGNKNYHLLRKKILEILNYQ